MFADRKQELKEDKTMKEKMKAFWSKLKKVLVFGVLFAFFGILKGCFTVARKLHMTKGASIALAGVVMMVVFCALSVGVGSLIMMV